MSHYFNRFWDALLIKLKHFMSKSGYIALVHQPRKPGSTDKDALDAGNKFSILLEKAGFKDIEIHKKKMKPVSTICVIGKL